MQAAGVKVTRRTVTDSARCSAKLSKYSIYFFSLLQFGSLHNNLLYKCIFALKDFFACVSDFCTLYTCTCPYPYLLLTMMVGLFQKHT